jgi:hypothetical protein
MPVIGVDTAFCIDNMRCVRTLIENDKVGRVGLATTHIGIERQRPIVLCVIQLDDLQPLARLAVAGFASGP